jgi:ferredoxin
MFEGNIAASGEKLTSNEEHIYWEVTRLAVSILNQRKQKSPGDGCLNCGQCQNGCPFGVVWNSWFDFQVEVLRLGATYLRANLISAKDLGKFVKVDYQEAEIISSVMIKRVFLTGGPLSTSRILLRSGIVESLHLVDSQTSMIMGISLRKKLLMRQHDNVSFPDTSFLYINKGNELALQSYSFSPYILSRLLPQPLATSKPLQKILKFLQKFLFVGLLYFDSSISGRLELDSSGRSNFVKGNDFLQKKIYKNFRYHMKKFGLFFIPKLKSLPVGGGYHLMGKFFPSNYWINEKTLEDQGMTKLSRLATFQGAERIHLLDSSILGHLPTGSVTLSSMATTTTLVKRILKANRLNNSGIQ